MTRVSHVLLVTALASVLTGTAIGAAPLHPTDTHLEPSRGIVLAQSGGGKNCRREPIWGFRISAFCKPTGICSDRVIKGYRTVCG
jgi:hypothetical protein